MGTLFSPFWISPKQEVNKKAGIKEGTHPRRRCLPCHSMNSRCNGKPPRSHPRNTTRTSAAGLDIPAPEGSRRPHRRPEAMFYRTFNPNEVDSRRVMQEKFNMFNGTSSDNMYEGLKTGAPGNGIKAFDKES